MKRLSIFLTALLVAVMSFAETKTVTINFGSTDGYCNFNSSTVKYTDAANMPWVMSVEDVSSSTTYYNASTSYNQIGSNNNPAKSITLTCTINTDITLTALSFNIEGASKKTKGTIIVKANETQYATGSVSGTSSITVSGSTSQSVETGKTIEISITSITAGFKLYSITYTYEPAAGTVSAPTFETKETDFTGTTEVKLKAEEGLAIYYTLDGTEPTATTGTQYNAEQPITINKTTTVKAIAYNTTTEQSSAVAEKTYTRYELITKCGDLIYAVNNDFVKLDKVTVIYVNGANMYICDKTGYGLLYEDSYGLEAGQEVEGIQGRITIYNGLTEIIPSVKASALTITEGTIPAPVAIAAVPTDEDLNKYVRIEGVKTTAATWSSEDTQASDRTLVAKLGEADLTLYNTFKINKTFAAGNYNIVGFVTCYNTTIEIAVVSATAVYTVEAVANEEAYGTVDGVGNYEEGESVTLKAEPATGYKFVKWTDLDDKAVSTDAEYTFTVTEDVALIANFVKDSATAIDAAESAKTATKTLENGVLVITRDGIRYTAQGVVME